ncbi:MAG: haloacid dehalogenase-like hydrolase [Clostridia bacterium]|nr:haloacid dehalogenase-like hydrolase [Clostridia bacterium]
MIADLYDYDGTICPGDTGSAFWLFCLVRRPYIVLFLPFQLIGGLCYLLGICDFLARNCSIHCYMRALNAPRLAQRFAEKRVHKTFSYFLRRDRARDVVVCSASPEFLLRPICEKLGVTHLIATDVDPKTGVVRGRVCKNTEKVRRLGESFPDCTFDRVFSDSLRHDTPILKLGRTAFLVRRGDPRQILP